MILPWISGLFRTRTGRVAGSVAGVMLTVALIAAVGAFLDRSTATMTQRALTTVPVDWQVELVSGASQADVVGLATKLELGATNAYAGQVAALKDPQLAHLFTQLSADEAVHWTTLNNAAGTPIPAKAFLFG